MSVTVVVTNDYTILTILQRELPTILLTAVSGSINSPSQLGKCIFSQHVKILLSHHNVHIIKSGNSGASTACV